MCCKCTTKPADYYVLTGQNPKSPIEMIALCDVCYQQQHHHHEHKNRRRRNNRIWYYHQHPRNGELHIMLAAYVDTMLISYVLEALPQSALIVKTAMLESLGMKQLKSWEKRERKTRGRKWQYQKNGVARYKGFNFFLSQTKLWMQEENLDERPIRTDRERKKKKKGELLELKVNSIIVPKGKDN